MSVLPKVSERQTSFLNWAIVVLTVAGALAVNRQRAVLVDPAACPGLLEAATAASSSLLNVPMAAVLEVMNAAAIVAALVLLAKRPRGSFYVNRKMTPEVIFAAACTPMFASLLAPSAGFAFAAACVAFLVRRPLAVGLALGLAAAIAPALTVPLALVAGWRATPLVALVVAPVLVRWPGAMSCALSPLTEASPGAALAALGQVTGAIGPAAWGLAALGAFTLATRPSLSARVASRFGSVLAIVPLVAMLSPRADPWRTLAPSVVALWLLAAAGASEVVRVLGSGIGRRLAAAVLLLAVPVLQYSRHAATNVPAFSEAWGHETLTRRDIARLLDVLPGNAALVVDDATSAIALGAEAGAATRRGKHITLISRHVDDVASALKSSRVFALPRAQRELQHQGVRIGSAVWPGVSGVSEISIGSSCRSPGPSWTPWPEVAGAPAFALVALHAADRGPIVVYLGGSALMDPSTAGWVPRETRGFHFGTFVMRDEGRRARLKEESGGDQLPADHPLFASPYVTRIEMWRVPGGARILPVSLSHSADAALVRLIGPSSAGGTRVCPSYPQEIERLQINPKNARER